MIGFSALLRREYLQHRGAFLYAPLLLIAVLTLLIALAFVSGHYRFAGASTGFGYRVFDTGYYAVCLLWGGYLFIALFFYFADAFNADRRNNQMFFWKSMPQADFKILMAKLIAGLTILPLLVFLAALLTGIIAAAATCLAPLALPILAPPDIVGTAWAWLDISVVALCYLVLGLLWYAPFFAWVGALSTIVGRWSIPLALLLPVVVSLFEGVVDFGSAPGGSYILSFLHHRLDLPFGGAELQFDVLSNQPLVIPRLTTQLVAGMDWPSVWGGLVFALVMIYLASQYRRRALKG